MGCEETARHRYEGAERELRKEGQGAVRRRGGECEMQGGAADGVGRSCERLCGGAVRNEEKL